MRWYRIEFYDKQHDHNKAAHAFAIVHRIAVVERQYSTQGVLKQPTVWLVIYAVKARMLNNMM